jgi:glycosyltransferase involved in cell wall biosynthesis
MRVASELREPARNEAAAAGLRFAMVTTFYPPYHFGGDAICVQRLARALARRGHQVDVIHDLDAFRLLYGGPEPEPIREPPGVRTLPLRARFGALACLATQQLGHAVGNGRAIRRLLEQGRYDVIHYHNISLVGGPAVLRLGAAIKLYLAHEHWLVCPTHVLWRHDREVCTGRQCIRCSLAHRRPPPLWRYTRLLERCAEEVDVFYSPSAFSAEKHAEFGFPRRLEVLPYFVPEPEPGERAALDEAPPWERPYFLFVGRLEKVKGLQDVLPHFHADAPADLLVVGAGGYEAELRRRAGRSGRVHFLGSRPADAVAPLYRHALATIFPSRGYETFGLVLIESLCEGTPVIARRLGPSPEIVGRTGGGLLFEDGAQLRDAIHRIAAEPGLRQALGQEGRKGVAEHYAESTVLEGYLAMIRRVARCRGLDDVLARIPAATARASRGAAPASDDA